MVVQYKDRFLKAFGITLALGAISLILGFYITANVGSLNMDNPEVQDVTHFNLRLTQLAAILVLITEALFIWTHYLLAKAKGYSGWLVLLAFLNIFGLLILFLLPDRRKEI